MMFSTLKQTPNTAILYKGLNVYLQNQKMDIIFIC